MFSTERECQRQQPWERASSVIETQTHCRGVALALQVQFTAAYAGPGKKTPPTWGMCHTIFTQHGKESLPTEGNEGNEEGICWDQEGKHISLAMYLWWAGSYVDSGWLLWSTSKWWVWNWVEKSAGLFLAGRLLTNTITHIEPLYGFKSTLCLLPDLSGHSIGKMTCYHLPPEILR